MRYSIRAGFYMLLGLVLAAGLSACAPGFKARTAAPSSSLYPIESVFRELYQDILGGESLAGGALSPMVARDGLQCQYLETALMCFDPQGRDKNRIFLYPLGNDLNVREKAQPVLNSQNAIKVDGYTVYEEFTGLYNKIQAQHVGRPLTNVRINYDLRRIEQFFESVGFYRSLDDPQKQVHLIPYGAYLYSQTRSPLHNEVWSTINAVQIEQPFSAGLLRMGGEATFGRPLSKPYLAGDGMLEQVYENAVLFASPKTPTVIQMRPLPTLVGIQPDDLELEVKHSAMMFVARGDKVGFNMPIVFDRFAANHGGPILGLPITGVYQVEGQNLYRQCLDNVCLDYDPQAGESLKVRLAPLGKEYLQKYVKNPENLARSMFSENTLTLRVSELKPSVAASEEQQIQLVLLKRQNNLPMENVEANLTLVLPNGNQISYPLGPTDREGKAVVTIPPLAGVKNGQLIGYKVCLKLPTDKPLCAADTYLIWSAR